MKVVKIPKRRPGEYRTIYVPDAAEKAKLRGMAGRIAEKAAKAPGSEAAHGFAAGRSPVTNALEHVGREYTMTFDLEDFFDSVTEHQLRGKLTNEEFSEVLVDGAARQGLPTSPAVANLAASGMDRAVMKMLKKRAPGTVYTRYADDMAFSFDDSVVADLLRDELPKITGRMGFRLNPRKTKLQCARAGRRVVTGVAVDGEGVHPTREAKRKLRAARHKKNAESARGLQEWMKLKLPRPPVVVEAERRAADELEKLRKAWRFRLPRGGYSHKGEDERLGEEVVITGDPVYALGMSTLTTGWKTCMRQPDGQYARGCAFWAALRGTRIAALLSEKKRAVAGVTRRVMRARALVHELRGGGRVYDAIYGNEGDKAELQAALEGAGYVSVAEARRRGWRGRKVEGHVPADFPRPHLDSLQASTSLAKTGRWSGKTVACVSV